ncbi:MAG: PIN domain-containing protein [Patescibacteria group bacterium]
MKAYLFDTNILISLFSKYTAKRTRSLLAKLKKNAVFYICGLVLSEFYQGIDKKDAEYYSAVLEDFPYLHSSRSIYENAGLTAHKLRKKGKTIPLGDCIVAATAKLYGATVVTLDKHFIGFPEIKVKHFVL